MGMDDAGSNGKGEKGRKRTGREKVIWDEKKWTGRNGIR